MAVRKGKKTKFSFRWTKELIFLLCGIVIMIVAVILLKLPSEDSKLVKEWQKYASAETTTQVLENDSVLKKISFNDLKKKVNDSSKYIYVFFGTPQDTTCQTYVNVFNLTAKDYDISTVYYLNADFVFDVEDKDDREFKNEIDEKEAKLDTNIDFFHYPSLWVFKDGALVFNSEDYFDETTNALATNFTWNTVASYWAYTGYSAD